MTAQLAVQIFVALFGGGGVAWLVGLWRDKRKADAEAGQHDAAAADLIEQASGRLVARFEQRFREDQDTITQLRRDRDALVRNAHAHEQWDRVAVARLAEFGVALPPPPTLHLEEPT